MFSLLWLQVNTLLQMENVASYSFMTDLIRNGQTYIHALWFDIYTGNIFCFSRRKKVRSKEYKNCIPRRNI